MSDVEVCSEKKAGTRAKELTHLQIIRNAREDVYELKLGNYEKSVNGTGIILFLIGFICGFGILALLVYRLILAAFS